MKFKIISLAVLFGLGVFGYIVYYNHIKSSQDLSAVRPFGFLRLEIPEDSLMSLDFQDNNLPFNFIFSSNGIWVNKPTNGWGDIRYPFCKARIQISYNKIEENLGQLINDAHSMTYKHKIVAEGIEEKMYSNSDRNVNGVLFKLYGKTASHIQFFATDSVSNFLRGAAYIYSRPNPDSLKPIHEFLENEVLQIIESLEWNYVSPKS